MIEADKRFETTTFSERERIRGWVETVGEQKVLEVIPTGKLALARAIAGLPIRPGSRFIILSFLQRFEQGSR